MNGQRHLILWCLVGLLVLLSGVLVWNLIFTSQNFFLAGQPPEAVTQSVPTEPKALPIRSTDVSRGPTDAQTVTIVEFADFACPYCRLTENALAAAIGSANRPVRLVWRDLPIPDGTPNPIVAALAGRCANDQGRFWEMHDALFQAPSLDIASIQQIAQGLSMNQTTFQACLNSGKYIGDIGNDTTLAQSSGIVSAPTIFIGSNEKAIVGLATQDELTAAIRNAKP